MAISIRQAENPADRDKVYRFRYQVYVEEMGREQIYADHDRKTIKEPLDDFASILAAFDGDEVIGTVRNNVVADGDIGLYKEFYGIGPSREEQERTSITTKLMVSPNHRSHLIAARLAQAIYEVAFSKGVRFDFIDCNDGPKNFFLKLGYVTTREQAFHPEYGSVTVMRLDLHDAMQLVQTRSPLYASLLKLTAQKDHLEPRRERCAILAPQHTPAPAFS